MDVLLLLAITISLISILIPVFLLIIVVLFFRRFMFTLFLALTTLFANTLVSPFLLAVYALFAGHDHFICWYIGVYPPSYYSDLVANTLLSVLLAIALPYAIAIYCYVCICLFKFFSNVNGYYICRHISVCSVDSYKRFICLYVDIYFLTVYERFTCQ